jgi:quercetin dioxygenase-like cupin family protein
MEVMNARDVEGKKVGSIVYKGRTCDVKGVTIQWLSKAGPDPASPAYGLRVFTIAPGAEIPNHDHFYVQTMYMLTGELIVYTHDRESDAVLVEKRIGAGDFVFVPTMEPHSMINPSGSQEAVFLCCIGNVYEDR